MTVPYAQWPFVTKELKRNEGRTEESTTKSVRRAFVAFHSTKRSNTRALAESARDDEISNFNDNWIAFVAQSSLSASQRTLTCARMRLQEAERTINVIRGRTVPSSDAILIPHDRSVVRS